MILLNGFIKSRLNEIEKFHGIVDHFIKNIPAWEAYCDTTDPHHQPLPAPWNNKLTMFEVSNR